MESYTRDFLDLAVAREALLFGDFTLKSGRRSPYFFNAGRFSDGASLERVARCYADAIRASGLEFDMLFGPAYKGIPLATAVAVSLQRDHGINRPFAYNRKEVKDHGEGGDLVGAELAGRVLIIDDVISAGTAVGESVERIRAHGARPVGVAVALDRQEQGSGRESAADELCSGGLEVITVATLDDLVEWLSGAGSKSGTLSAMLAYRDRYGIARS